MSDRKQKARCAAIVLAAGASIRLGQPKQLLTLNGESLLYRTVRLAFEAGCSPVLAVLGFGAKRMQQELSGSRAKTVVNPNWQSGMGSSLRCGISALMAEDRVPSKTMLLVCDQAKLSVEILSELIQVNTQGSSLITASRYAGKFGVPVIFDGELYPDLLEVEGDQGARSVIQRYADQTSAVEFSDGIIDIDIPEDLANLSF